MTEITTPSTVGNLIPVFTAEIGGVATHVVNGRDLHEFLGLKRDFSTWIKKRIADYQFVENEDYALPRLGELENSGLQTKIEYHLTLTMAKELGMLERNDNGRMVRKYFIECERKIHEIHQITEQASRQPTTEIPPYLETKRECLFGKAVLHRAWFWTLEKRDRIVHPGIDRYALHSITMDIYIALKDELIDEAARLFPECHHEAAEVISFVMQWEPEFIRNRHY